MDMYIWLCKDTGAMNRPLRLTECFVGVCGMFATHFVGGRCIIANRSPHFGRPQAAVGVRFIVPAYTYSQQHCTPFEMPSRNVRNVFILCMLHIHHAKVWFLRHKSMVFGVQKPPFYIAKTPFLKYKNGVLNLEHIRQYKNTECFCCHTDGQWICKKNDSIMAECIFTNKKSGLRSPQILYKLEY